MILGIDPGGRRVGVAIADYETRFARPLEVIDLETTDLVQRLEELITSNDVKVVVVGRPTGLSGTDGPAVEAQRGLLRTLQEGLAVPVEEHDERLTTVIAERGLRAGGAGRATRRTLRDAVAAQVMLQGYLDATR